MSDFVKLKIDAIRNKASSYCEMLDEYEDDIERYRTRMKEIEDRTAQLNLREIAEYVISAYELKKIIDKIDYMAESLKIDD